MAGGGQEAWVAPSVHPDWFGGKKKSFMLSFDSFLSIL